jgi:PilZ domain
MEFERRRATRTRPEVLSYIQFEPEGGGIVLNASEEGLAFQAAAAVRQRGPIRLCISPNLEQRIQLTAEIAWMDEAKKSGGLRLKEVSADTGDQIRRWLAQTTESGHQQKELGPPAHTVNEAPPISSAARDNSPDLFPLAAASHEAPPAYADAVSVAVPRFPGISTPSTLWQPPSPESRSSFLNSRPLRDVATGFLILILILMPILFLQNIFFQNIRVELGNSLIRIGEKLKGTSDNPIDPAAARLAPIPAQETPDASSVPAPSPKTPATETAYPSDQPSAAQAQQGTAPPVDATAADHPDPPQSIADTHPRNGRSATARQLWSAVEAGDSSAEVELARLYLTGDGVPRNCEQARVLLRAASKKGNSEAAQQLRKIKISGCRAH